MSKFPPKYDYSYLFYMIHKALVQMEPNIIDKFVQPEQFKRRYRLAINLSSILGVDHMRHHKKEDQMIRILTRLIYLESQSWWS